MNGWPPRTELEREQEELLAEYRICVGRDREIELIRDWVSGAQGGFRVVTAEAGVGKTSFMRALSDAVGSGGFEVKSFFFRAMTKCDSLESFTAFISENDLRESPPPDVKRVLLVDALDEASCHVDELRWRWDRLAPNVFVVLSVRAPRDDGDLLDLPHGVRSVLRRRTSPIEPSLRISLAELTRWEDIDHLLRSAARRKGLDPNEIPGFERYVASVLDKSRGYPLYISFLADDIAQAPALPDDTPSWDDYVARAWESLCRTKSDNSYLLLPLVAVAKRALSQRELRDIWAAMYPGDRSLDSLTALPRDVTRWLSLTRSESGYTIRFTHDALRDQFRCSRTSFESAYLAARDGLMSSAFKNLDWDYSLSYLPEHCAERADTKTLTDLFLNLDYQSDRCQHIGLARFASFVFSAEAQFGAVHPTYDEAALIVNSLDTVIAQSGLRLALQLAPLTYWGQSARESARSSGKPWIVLQEGWTLKRSPCRLVIPPGHEEAPMLAVASGTLVAGMWFGWLRVFAPDLDGLLECTFEYGPSSEAQRGEDPQFLCVASGDELIAIGREDGSFRLWQLDARGDLRRVFDFDPIWLPEEDTADGVFSILFVDGCIVTGHYSGTVRVWEPNAEDGFEITSHLELPDSVSSLASIGSTIVCGHDGGQLRWLQRTSDGRLTVTFESALAPSTGVAVSSVGEKVVSGHDDGCIRLWGFSEDWRLLGEQEIATWSWVNCLAPVPGGFISGHNDGRVRVWELLTTGDFGLAFQSEDLKPVESLVAIGSRAVSAHADGSVRIWEQDLRGLDEISLTMKGPVLYDGRWFDYPEPEKLADYPWLAEQSEGLSTVYALCSHEDLVYSGHRDGAIRVWEPDSSGQYHLILESARTEPVVGLQVADGRLISSHRDGRILAWEMEMAFREVETATELDDTMILILAGENDHVEFKETLEFADRPPAGLQGDAISKWIASKRVERKHEVLKTICAFLNSRGGTLLIGVHDSAGVVGIDPDYTLISSAKDRGRDGFERKLRSLVDDQIKLTPVGKVHVRFPIVSGKILCRIDVDADVSSFYLAGRYYVRDGNRTIALDDHEREAYIQNRRSGFGPR